MEQEETDVTIVAAVSGVIGVIIGFGLANRYRRKKMQQKLDAHLERVMTINRLQVEMGEWMAENAETMDHEEFFEQLRVKALYLNVVAHEV